MICAICSADENWGIGSKGDLLVHIPEDMKFFKEMTTDNLVIMGRKTYDSLPNKPLPNRFNYVITSNMGDDNIMEVKNDGTAFVTMNYVKNNLSDVDPRIFPCDIYIIGGGTIYKELLPYCEYIYVTKVLYAYDDADTFFPNIDDMEEWQLMNTSVIKEYNGTKYQFCIYKRKEV